MECAVPSTSKAAKSDLVNRCHQERDQALHVEQARRPTASLRNHHTAEHFVIPKNRCRQQQQR